MADERDDSAKWADLRDEMSKPDSDPVVAAIEGPSAPEPQQRSEPTNDQLAERYLDNPRALDNWQPQQRQQPRSTEHDHGGDIADYRATAGNELPDVHEDPIGHFNARNGAIEQAILGDRFENTIKEAERHARNELGEDYDHAIAHLSQSHMADLYAQYPDHPAVDQYARSYGHASAAHMRQEIFKRDALVLAQQAIANGHHPGFVYYNAALRRGYLPQVDMTKSARDQINWSQDQDPDTQERGFQAAKWAAKKYEEHMRQRAQQQRSSNPWLFR